MARRRTSQSSNKANPPGQTEWTNHPFQELKRLLPKPPAPAKVEPPAAPPPKAPAEPPVVDDNKLFERAVAGVRPLPAPERERVELEAPAANPREITNPDAEVLAELSDLVQGNAPFDITSSDEHIEGYVVGLDPQLIRKLRNGEFAYQGFLDLHRLTSDEARRALEPFLIQSYQAGKRCVLIIHGRGRNSKDQIPVLKQRLGTWLTRGQWSHWVLAFTSARPCDGGVGAMYVLLRKRHHPKKEMRVTNGAKV